MTELEYVISNFETRFSRFKGRRIVLHGSREYAQAIIEHFDPEYHFIGVMSRDPIDGSDFHGLPVLREEDIPALDIDLILLTERVRYAEAVYAFIYTACEQAGILLYDMYGLDEINLHRDIFSCRPQNLEAWKTICATYDLVAFEVMDTLLHRNFLSGEFFLRKPFDALIPWLQEKNILVKFSLRKSFSEDLQVKQLDSLALCRDLDSHIIRRNGEDLSFRVLREEHPGKKILYIGSGLVNECILPRYYGIDTYRFSISFDSLAPVGGKSSKIYAFDAGRRIAIQREIRNSKTVSFDIFDTLLVRKTLFPKDVFALTELRGKAAGYPADGFALLREEAERDSAGGSMDQIYAILCSRSGWDTALCEKMRQLELEVERTVLLPRTEIVQLLDYALAQGKRVVLTSDMYMSEPVICELLEEKGIRGFDRIFVSCDWGKRKQTGLFDTLREFGCAEPILHIGDDFHADGMAAEQAGLHPEILPSPLAMAVGWGWEDCISAAGTLVERCLLGSVIAEIFRDPFQNPDLQERPREDQLHRFAVGVLAPLVVGYLCWLITQLRSASYDGVLFLARDGYLPMRIYQKLCRRLSLPSPVYFYANRHSSFLCVADLPGTVDYVAAMGEKAGFSREEILKKIYHLDADKIRPPQPGETTCAYLLRHMPEISIVAAAAKTNYRTYADLCGLREGGFYAICDGFSVGRTQSFLEHALPCCLRGFNLGRYRADVGLDADIAFYFLEENAGVLNNFIEIESFLLSPEPSLDMIDGQGNPVFQAEHRSPEELSEVQFVLADAERSALQFFETFYRDKENISPLLTERIFAADGCHWVQHAAFDDWAQVAIETRPWVTADREQKSQEQ
ncbi:MAG: hypothetical protein IJ179_06560 [Oscillospiraceae bacterium]|nr:hypothetical protein [Oscillospiraceae bacterium]